MRRFRADDSWRRVYWIEEALDPYAGSVELAGTHRADIAIIGGGLVGLWTAITLKEDDPQLDIAIVEGAFCGYGASGRNGGFVYPWTTKADLLLHLYGPDQAGYLMRESIKGIERIEAFCAASPMPTHYTPGRTVWAATGVEHIGSWDEAVAACAATGLADQMTVLGSSRAAALTGSAAHLDGVAIASSGTVNPARLVAALKHHAGELGVRIYEGSPVTGIGSTRSGAHLATAAGRIDCHRLVIATNAWAHALPALRNKLFVISSDIFATEPAPADLDHLGWAGDTAIFDSHLMLDYYRQTVDRRVVFGKGGWTIAFAGRMPGSIMRAGALVDLAYADFTRYFPTLGRLAVTHRWAGPIDRSYDSLPLIGHLDDHGRIIYGVGWSGDGVGGSGFGSRIMAALARGEMNDAARCGLVDRTVRTFPPEPVRYVGSHVVRAAIAGAERAEARGGRPGRIRRALTGFAPTGVVHSTREP